MEFVEQHRGDALEHRIVEDEPGENSLGDDFDARFARNLRAEAHPQAYGLADALVERRRHARGGGARGEPARFEHQDAAVLGPVFAGENERHARGLAGARRRHQHGGVVGAQRRGQIRQRGVDRQRGKVHVSTSERHSGARTKSANPESIVTTGAAGLQRQFCTGCDDEECAAQLSTAPCRIDGNFLY